MDGNPPSLGGSPINPRTVTHHPKDAHPPEGSVLHSWILADRSNSLQKPTWWETGRSPLSDHFGNPGTCNGRGLPGLGRSENEPWLNLHHTGDGWRLTFAWFAISLLMDFAPKGYGKNFSHNLDKNSIYTCVSNKKPSQWGAVEVKTVWIINQMLDVCKYHMLRLAGRSCGTHRGPYAYINQHNFHRKKQGNSLGFYTHCMYFLFYMWLKCYPESSRISAF